MFLYLVLGLWCWVIWHYLVRAVRALCSARTGVAAGSIRWMEPCFVILIVLMLASTGLRANGPIAWSAIYHTSKFACSRSIRYASTKTPKNTPNSHSHDHHEGTPSHSHSHSSGHSHSHRVTGELLSTGNLGNPAVRITLIGFVANLGMAVAKGVGGVLFHSQSLIADAIHALSDLVSDVMTLSTVSVAKKEPSQLFPNGYGRIETVGAFGVSSMLLFAGLSMGWSSFSEILVALNVDLPGLAGISAMFSHSHSHSHAIASSDTGSPLPAEWSAAGVALASIFIKEALYRATRNVAEKQNSPVLYANAWHHRVDCLVSVVAVVSISAGQLFQLAWVDPLGGLAVSAVIVRAGWRPAVDAMLELCGNVRPVAGTPAFQEFENRARTELSVIAPSYKIVKCTLEPYGSTFVGSVQLENIDHGAEEVAAELKQSLMKMDHMRQVYVRI